ncbi:ParA family protein [Pseudoroseomonas sp. WGS1072]|uniref:ParA family protein n=1 Tax=Roseomonas sp. WGS1072 TaxID=3366816 RepID=UPI003BEFB472
MTDIATFDTSLPLFVQAVRDVLGSEALEAGQFLRDATGALTFIVPSITDQDASLLTAKVLERLSPYADATRGVVITADAMTEDDGAPSFLNVQVRVPDERQSRMVKLIDRRVVGQDWTRTPRRAWHAPEPARVVFWSLKGGVGRTTALAVVGAHLARLGKKVLAMDLDLEAPGLGSVLLGPNDRPPFGVLDWFVERALTTEVPFTADQLIGPVRLSEAAGLFHVAPAMGQMAIDNPQHVVAKLGRAYLESMSKHGALETFLDKAEELSTFLLRQGEYDVLLVDARAGLNEATAAAILGLGADVLMFGNNTPQTFEGYRYALSHLNGFPATATDDWRLRLKMVHARASASKAGRESFRDRAYDLFRECIYKEDADPFGDDFTFGIDDQDAPHAPWVVLDDERFREFEPLEASDLLTEKLVQATFGDLISGLMRRTDP